VCVLIPAHLGLRLVLWIRLSRGASCIHVRIMLILWFPPSAYLERSTLIVSLELWMLVRGRPRVLESKIVQLSLEGG
jgi:hypothetical protein